MTEVSSDIVICGYAVQALTCGAPADGRYLFYVFQVVESSFVCTFRIVVALFYRDLIQRYVSVRIPTHRIKLVVECDQFVHSAV